MSKKTGTKNYSRDFREKAVKLVTERGYPYRNRRESHLLRTKLVCAIINKEKM